MGRDRSPSSRWLGGIGLLGALMLLAPAAAAAATEPPTETPLSKMPGYFPLEELDILGRKELSTEINLQKPLLKLVAAATRKSEPAFSQLLASLDAVRVWIAEPEDVDLVRVRARIARAADWLEDHHWNVVVRTRDDGEEVFIYLRQIDDEITGMAVLAIGSDNEVALINIVGAMDLSQLERLSARFDLPSFSMPETDTDEKEPNP